MQNYSFLFKIAEPYKGLFKIYKYPSGESYLERLEVNSNKIKFIFIYKRLVNRRKRRKR